MSELRLNRVTGDWVIVAPIREKGSVKTFSSIDVEPNEDLEYVENCPFCEGNEWMTLPEVFALRDPGAMPNEPGWRVRVVPDRYPALSRIRSGVSARENDFFLKVEGYGVHENIIESPIHNLRVDAVTNENMTAIFKVMVQRYRLFESDPKIHYIAVFRNRGRRAGATVLHPHSQIIASPYVPPLVSRLVKTAERHHQKNKNCVFCQMIENELEADSRVIMETRRFVAIHPFASQAPYETWILPKKHRHRFGAVTTHSIEELAVIVKSVVKSTRYVYKVPDYHMLINSAPVGDRYEKSYHWYMQFVPRRIPSTSLEMHSGVRVTTIAPETSAKRIKEYLAADMGKA